MGASRRTKGIDLAGGYSATATYTGGAKSLQLLAGDLTLVGQVGHTGGYLGGGMGNVLGASPTAPSNNGATTAGLIGKYAITGTTYTPGYPRAGVVAEMGGHGDAALVAVITDGDVVNPNPRAFIGFDWQCAPSAKYTYAIDMQGVAHDVYGAIPDPDNAVLRFPNGTWLVMLSTAITANATLTSAPAGSLGFTSHATGNTRTFKSDGTNWQATA